MTITRLPDNFPQLLRAEGLTVVEIPGWQNRGRPVPPHAYHPGGVLWHHTGDDNRHATRAQVLAYVKNVLVRGRSDLVGPLCQVSIARDGVVYVVAAGRCNHAGVARPSGPMAGGDGNAIYVGVEVQNNGTEGYGKPQYEAMVVVGKVLSSKVIGCSAQANRAHKETSETGKWDPGALVMSRFREDLDHAINARKAPKMNNVQAAHIKLAQAQVLLKAAQADLDAAPKNRTVVHQQAELLRGDRGTLAAHVDGLPEQ